ncbi:MAG: Hpt domain-containing protein [Thiomicrospira sp.]|uniref:Hpt domain-containing protein n=1 Tax=Thiomicrospira sp. TaxID=935 RepID=UPI0019FCBC09|nr:Hpt domain-containing protein [Thiomicrospira sp.]MBE0493511.1 Hpt domain-containing protein [Thiomicrospira sp.]
MLKQLVESIGKDSTCFAIEAFEEELAEFNCKVNWNDTASLATLAHSLKGSARVVGALALTAVFESIEYRAKDNQTLDAVYCINQIEQFSGESLQLLKAALEA